MRRKIAWMFDGGMRWNELLESSVVIQSSPEASDSALRRSPTS